MNDCREPESPRRDRSRAIPNLAEAEDDRPDRSGRQKESQGSERDIQAQCNGGRHCAEGTSDRSEPLRDDSVDVVDQILDRRKATWSFGFWAGEHGRCDSRRSEDGDRCRGPGTRSSAPRPARPAASLCVRARPHDRKANALAVPVAEIGAVARTFGAGAPGASRTSPAEAIAGHAEDLVARRAGEAHRETPRRAGPVRRGSRNEGARRCAWASDSLWTTYSRRSTFRGLQLEVENRRYCRLPLPQRPESELHARREYQTGQAARQVDPGDLNHRADGHPPGMKEPRGRCRGV